MMILLYGIEQEAIDALNNNVNVLTIEGWTLASGTILTSATT
jgi:hypothetical protein